MSLRLRLLGILIIACGIAFCHGAVVVWPGTPFDATLSSLTVGALQIAISAIAAVLGVLNVAAGAVVLLSPVRAGS